MIIIGFVLLFFVLGLVVLLILSDLLIFDWLLIVLIVLIVLVIVFFIICYMYMDIVFNGVEIIENQLLEIYFLYIDLVKEMGFGIKKIKDVMFLFN